MHVVGIVTNFTASLGERSMPTWSLTAVRALSRDHGRTVFSPRMVKHRFAIVAAATIIVVIDAQTQEG